MSEKIYSLEDYAERKLLEKEAENFFEDQKREQEAFIARYETHGPEWLAREFEDFRKFEERCKEICDDCGITDQRTPGIKILTRGRIPILGEKYKKLRRDVAFVAFMSFCLGVIFGVLVVSL